MKKNIGQLTSEVFALLDGQEKEDINKVLASVSTLLGVEAPKGNQIRGGNMPDQNNLQGGLPAPTNAKNYFDQKLPKGKTEDFAVAAKFRIDGGVGDIHTKEDFKTVIKTQAKRSFDDGNFARDMDNAIRAGYFMKGDTKGEFMLSGAAEKYVDALPDRAAAIEAKNSVKAVKKAKKKTTKKAAK